MIPAYAHHAGDSGANHATMFSQQGNRWGVGLYAAP
jgi:hypothetical protein